MAHQEEIAGGRELQAGDEELRFGRELRAQIADQSHRVTPLGQKHLPALIEIRFRREPAHHMRDFRGELALEADLEQLDLTHHTLPFKRSLSLWDKADGTGSMQKRQPARIHEQSERGSV